MNYFCVFSKPTGQSVVKTECLSFRERVKESLVHVAGETAILLTYARNSRTIVHRKIKANRPKDVDLAEAHRAVWCRIVARESRLECAKEWLDQEKEGEFVVCPRSIDLGPSVSRWALRIKSL